MGLKEKRSVHQGPAYNDINDGYHHKHEEVTSRKERQTSRKTGLTQRLAYLSLTSVVNSCYIYFHMAAEQGQQLHHYDHHRRTSGEVEKRKERHQERRQRHPHHI